MITLDPISFGVLIAITAGCVAGVLGYILGWFIRGRGMHKISAPSYVQNNLSGDKYSMRTSRIEAEKKLAEAGYIEDNYDYSLSKFNPKSESPLAGESDPPTVMDEMAKAAEVIKRDKAPDDLGPDPLELHTASTEVFNEMQAEPQSRNY